MNMDIAAHRLHNQYIQSQQPQPKTPADVVLQLGAMQAQDYPASLWAIGLRLPGTTESAIEQAITDRLIVRTWPMRGTLHFIPAADVRWMLQLMTPRIIAQSASRHKQLELDSATFALSQDVFIQALQGGRVLTRNQMFEVLQNSGIPTTGQRGIHILMYLAQIGLLCFAPRQDKQFTFTLLDEWLPPAPTRTLSRDEALATIAQRYFTGHGPATLKDFVRWTGLTVADAKIGLEAVKSQFIQQEVAAETYWMPPSAPHNSEAQVTVHLLPAFDEYLVGYKDRTAVLAPQHAMRVIPGSNGMFNPVIISQGQVIGTYKRTLRKNTVIIQPALFRPFTPAEQDSFHIAAHRYAHFLGTTATIESSSSP